MCVFQKQTDVNAREKNSKLKNTSKNRGVYSNQVV